MKRALVLVAVLGCGGEKAGPDQKPPEAATTGSASVVVEPMAATLAAAKAVEAAEPAAVAIHAEHAAALQAVSDTVGTVLDADSCRLVLDEPLPATVLMSPVSASTLRTR